MKVVTVISDDENPGFFLLKLSCAIYELELTTLVTTKKHFQTNRLKDSLLSDYLEEINSDELILYTDGYDAVFLTGENEVIDKYKRFNKRPRFLRRNKLLAG